MASVVEGLLGSELVDGKKAKVSVASVVGRTKVIGLYFSAHWCPPCRGFTPQLAQFYNKMKSSGNFEVIFISSDQTEAQWAEYFAEMPWLALPFSDRATKQAVSSKYGVTGIPTLVLLDSSTGATININARMNVVQDPNGAKFPWNS